jgi:hypothetical protein
VFRAARYQELIAVDSSILGRLASRAGRHDDAVRRLTEALTVAEESGSTLLAVGVIGFLAEDLVRQGDPEAALELVARADERAGSIGGPGVYEPLLERVRGCAHLLRNDPGGAREALDRSLSSARGAGSEFEVLLTLHARRSLRERSDGPSAIEDAEASSIADRLGVVAYSPLLPDDGG